MKNAFLLLTFVLFLFVSCNKGADDSMSDTMMDSASLDNLITNFDSLNVEEPILVTSIGQSAEIAMSKVLLGKTGVSYTSEPLITADKIGDYKTVLLVVGGSSKGMGAAGISEKDELTRTQMIVEALAPETTVVVVHLGGSVRRGPLSDQYIEAVLPASDAFIVVKGGDEDHLFANYAAENQIPYVMAESIGATAPVFADLFK